MLNNERMAKRVFGLTGSSNSGKTTLVEHLIAWFRSEGYVISTVKHAHQGFDIDRPGKDSYRMREAGAHEVCLIGDKRWVLMREYHDEDEPSLESLIEQMAPCDIVLVEGFRRSPIPKIEVYRRSLGIPPAWPQNPTVVAVATEEAIDCPLPVLDINRPAEVAAYIRESLFPRTELAAVRRA